MFKTAVESSKLYTSYCSLFVVIHLATCIVKNKKTAMLLVILMLVFVVMIVSVLMVQTIAAAPNEDEDDLDFAAEVCVVTLEYNAHLL